MANIVKVSSIEELHTVAETYNVERRGRSATQLRQPLALAIFVAGDTIDDTDFLRKADAAGTATGDLPDMVYTVQFHTGRKDGTRSAVKTETLTTDQVVKLTPTYTGKTITNKRITMALAAHLNIGVDVIFPPVAPGRVEYTEKAAETPVADVKTDEPAKGEADTDESAQAA